MNDLFPSTSEVTFRQIQMNGSTIKQWRAPELNLKTKVVCATCNNGWMSDIENLYAKPAMTDLILGERVGAITKKRAHGISLFAFKTAVIANRGLPESEFFFGQPERYTFRTSLAIPSDVTMWLVGMEPVARGGISSHNVHFGNQRWPNLTLNVCSFCVGQLGFQVVCAKAIRGGQVHSLPMPMPNLTVRFYPTVEPNIRWPRSHVLSVEAFNDFANRWNKIRRL